MCGLVGFYPKKNKQVNLSALYFLWALNEERGTHSCGIAYGNVRKVGINGLAKARDFISSIADEMRTLDLKNQPIICHTRHATSGAHTANNAHPFEWYRGKEENYFMFAHNGVIKDLDNLKKKLKLNHYDSMIQIDSHALGLAVYDTFVNVLTEQEVLESYEGNAAFLCYDAQGVFKAWKGANLGVEERPLYYVETKEGWYFCSIRESLFMGFLQEPITVPNNTLITFKNNKLFSTIVYERNIKPLVSSKGYTPYEKDYYDSYDDYVVKNNSYSAGFKNLMINKTEKTKNLTGISIIDNLLTLNLPNLLKKSTPSKEEIHKENTQGLLQLTAPDIKGKIELIKFGPDKGKYCIRENYTEVLINGVKPVDFENSLITDFMTHKNAILMNFDNGVLIKKGLSYSALLNIFKATIQKSCEDIFNAMYPLAKHAIIDIIPFYKDDNLFMLLYNNKGTIDYISVHDNIDVEIISAIEGHIKISPSKNHKILTINNIKKSKHECSC